MSDTLDGAQAIVIDNGSGIFRAGLTGEDAPTASFPSVFGYPKLSNIVSCQITPQYVGDEAIAKKGSLNLIYPIERGIVTHHDAMERIWLHCFYSELRKDPEDHPCMLTEAPCNPKANREKMAISMFEVFNVPSFSVQNQAVLSLYASGRTTGIVIASGDGVTHTVPIYEGFSMPHAAERIDLAGRDLTEYLMRRLSEAGLKFFQCFEAEIIKIIKEQFCYVALDPKKEAEEFKSSPNPNKPYALPDETTVILQDQVYQCPELLFNPSLIEKDFSGIHTLAFNSIMKCDVDLRRELYSNIVLQGGSTMFRGFAERISKEISELASPTVSVKVYAPPDRKYTAWIGGVILSSLASFQPMWITKAEYEDSGPSIVHRKCF